MNLLHNWYCRSGHWRAVVRGRLLPWALAGVELGERVLELGPGPGLTTEVLAERADSLTVVEADRAAGARLARRLDGAVRVVVADAAAMPLRSGAFTAVACFTMLHHVPAVRAQDSLFAEAHRVLRPAGVLVGTDSLTGFLFRLVHLGDTHRPVDPRTLPERLRRAGFVDVAVNTHGRAVRFRARRPG
jgi:SAM-dependent methyltransferase